ncbi:MAG: BspA family leucine-rich repeat surface protein [Candidatus Methanofishera endochildressiae]|uniref:BspA family leucine-rich repeat surface protein n=1 Tax=Candidatus Methanofishera endochildressiae TaxID=2738884 RepID=A0A7Z0SC88_9GAMM|nr:BspA family leucine-rich repeat surface protein [Candidatus Methanofishera endochildressiae]
MWSSFSSTTNVGDISNWNTLKVTNMSHMFMAA